MGSSDGRYERIKPARPPCVSPCIPVILKIYMICLPLAPLHDQRYHAADRSINIYIGRGEAGASQKASTFQSVELIHLLAVVGPAGGLHHSFVHRRIVIMSLHLSCLFLPDLFFTLSITRQTIQSLRWFQLSPPSIHSQSLNRGRPTMLGVCTAQKTS